jgi:hypothetical protein
MLPRPVSPVSHGRRAPRRLNRECRRERRDYASHVCTQSLGSPFAFNWSRPVRWEGGSTLCLEASHALAEPNSSVTIMKLLDERYGESVSP